MTQKYISVGSSSSISSAAARNGGGGARGGTNGFRYASISANEHATFIVGAAFRRNSTLSSSPGLFTFSSDGNATTHITVGVDNSGKLYVKRGSSTGTSLGTESGFTLGLANVWHYVEAKITLSDTVGVAVVRVDESIVINLSAQDTKNAGTKTVFDNIMVFDGGGALTIDCDDFYICNGAGSVNNDFMGDIKIETLYPNGNGNSSQLVGSDADSTNNYQLVDETPPNTTDYVGSATTDQKDTYAYGNTTIAGNVKGIQVNTYAQKTDAGARSFCPVIRRSSTDYDGTDTPVGTGFAIYEQLYENDPSTSAAWTTTNVDAAEFGVKVR